MADRLACLERLDRQFLAAGLAHEAASNMHRDLVELGADNEHTRELLRDSAALTLDQMPALARPLRASEREWEEQELLDPVAAEVTAMCLEMEIEELLPAFRALRARQNEIVAQLRALVNDAQ